MQDFPQQSLFLLSCPDSTVGSPNPGALRALSEGQASADRESCFDASSGMNLHACDTA
jgi:hypothetical protein